MLFRRLIGACLIGAVMTAGATNAVAQVPPPATSAAPAAAPAPPAEPPTAPDGKDGAATPPPTTDTPGATAPTAETPTAETPGDEMDGATYAVRLRDLQQRIDALKEQIRKSHTRLSLLSDTILNTGSTGSAASIRFENKMSDRFRLVEALVVLDGAVQYKKRDETGALSDQKVIPVFTGSLPPGDHTVQVLVNLQGHGYGVFSYLRGYKFQVRSSHSFTAIEGKTTRLRVVAYEKGGVATPFEERPAVRYLEKIVSGLAGGSKAAE